MDAVDVKALQVPPSTLSPSDLEELKSSCASRRWARTPFPIDQDINERVILYDGDIELLKAEAIVNPTNENLNHICYVSHMAGPELELFIKRKVRLCATGEVKVTPGFASNYQHIIHAVPPKYQAKYKTAAETALFHTYFRVLETMIERKIRTVVMPALATSKCNMPIEENCNLQLRILRRILEKKRHEFDRIVIHARENLEQYQKLFYCYFPRTQLDEELACFHFTGSLGGPNGEPVIPEREIRIKSKPAASISLDQNDNSIDLTSGLDLSTVVGNTEFSKMREDLEEDRRKAAAANNAGRSSILGSSSPIGKYLGRQNTANGRSSQAANNQRALQRRSVLTGCNLF